MSKSFVKAQVYEQQGRHEQEHALFAGMSKSSASSRHEQVALRQVYEEQEQGMSSEQRKRGRHGRRAQRKIGAYRTDDASPHALPQRMQADAGGCWRMLADAGGCWRMQA
jgi:hypothetical protein